MADEQGGALVEKVARAICKKYGTDPDREIRPGGKKPWELWINEARAAIAAVRAYDASPT